MNKVVWSVGVGKQTAIACIMAADGLIPGDYGIFADTGAEQPETYEYLYRVLVPELKKRNWQLIIVSPQGEFNTYPKIDAWYLLNRQIPYRNSRKCTERWKIRPIRRYLKKHEPKGCQVALGITMDEVQRMKDSDNPLYPNIYPLIDLRLARDDLDSFYKKFLIPIAPKSGCYFCPFQRKGSWISLKEKHPDLWELACKMELQSKQELEKKGKPFYGFRMEGMHKAKEKPYVTIDLIVERWENKRDQKKNSNEEDVPCGSSCFT